MTGTASNVQVVRLREGKKRCVGCGKPFIDGVSIRVKCQIPPFVRLCASCADDLKAGLNEPEVP
jgi:hypothetical protein